MRVGVLGRERESEMGIPDSPARSAAARVTARRGRVSKAHPGGRPGGLPRSCAVPSVAESSLRCASSHVCVHARTLSVVICRRPVPHPANQSAISLPGTRMCDRTCRNCTSPPRFRCTSRHRRRRRAMSGAFRFPAFRGIHFPVVMCMAYRESECMHSAPAPRGRVSARSSALCMAVSSPVLLV